MQGLEISRKWRLLGFVAIIAAILSLGAIACGSDDNDDNGGATATQEVTPSATEGTPAEGTAGKLDITAVEFSYKNVPASQPGGLTTITLNNIGVEDHQSQFVKLNEGVTFDQLQSALQSDTTGAAALALVSVAGGVNAIPAGTSQDVTEDLTEGSYAMLCFVSGADGLPHVAKGMIAPFEVTAPGAEQAEEPVADAEIAAADFTFTGDTTLTAGENHAVKLTNNGPQPHEMGIVKLDEGFTVDGLRGFFSNTTPPEDITPTPGVTPIGEGPPPFSAAGGLGAIMPNTDAYAIVKLEAGNYALICFVPDQTTGAPHAALGMVTALTVE